MWIPISADLLGSCFPSFLHVSLTLVKPIVSSRLSRIFQTGNLISLYQSWLNFPLASGIQGFCILFLDDAFLFDQCF